jgi:P-type Cu+ transporter
MRADGSAVPGLSTAPPTSPRAGPVEYTCPMHPEVRQMGPGHCPVCGMSLEPVVAAASKSAPSFAT